MEAARVLVEVCPIVLRVGPGNAGVCGTAVDVDARVRVQVLIGVDQVAGPPKALGILAMPCIRVSEKHVGDRVGRVPRHDEIRASIGWDLCILEWNGAVGS